MELRTLDGYYSGNETQIELPTPKIIKSAILNLDFSTGALTNQEVAELLATQFCLSNKQKNVTRDRNVRIWSGQVNGAIQDLAIRKKIVRTMPNTIITPDALKNMVEHFLGKLRYEPRGVEVRDKDNDNCNVSIQILTKTKQGEGKTFTVEVTPR